MTFLHRFVMEMKNKQLLQLARAQQDDVLLLDRINCYICCFISCTSESKIYLNSKYFYSNLLPSH